jgi:acetylornithine/N-succinyldiaminopimelate aminotransferase
LAQKYKVEPCERAVRKQDSLLRVYRRKGISFTGGKGSRVWDSSNREYIDFVGGIAVNVLGHSNHKLVSAICNQASNIIHTSNLYEIDNQSVLSSMIAGFFTGRKMKVFFSNSGAEANEAALKFSVKATGRKKFISAFNSFHGRTAMALSVTGQPKYWKGFEPLIYGNVEFFDYGSAESLREHLDADVAAVILEPIQGEGGVIVPPAGFLSRVSQMVHDNGSLLIMDEIQTGIGRTGRMFAHMWEPACRPDIVTLAKGLAGGVPIGATIVSEEVASRINEGDHGSTFGGNPLATAAGIATLETIRSAGFLEGVVSRGVFLREKLEASLGKFDKLVEIRGKGLMLGMEFSGDVAGKLADYAFERNILVNVAHDTVVRLLPPLIITEEEIETLAATVRSFCSQAV